jgi:hypothetical protein
MQLHMSIVLQYHLLYYPITFGGGVYHPVHDARAMPDTFQSETSGDGRG